MMDYDDDDGDDWYNICNRYHNIKAWAAWVGASIHYVFFNDDFNFMMIMIILMMMMMMMMMMIIIMMMIMMIYIWNSIDDLMIMIMMMMMIWYTYNILMSISWL
jgi:hypothetical protein